MAKKGLKEWLDEKWVDIGAPKKNGKFQPCGRSKRFEEKVSKVRPTCKSHTDDKARKGRVLSDEKELQAIRVRNQLTLQHSQKEKK